MGGDASFPNDFGKVFLTFVLNGTHFIFSLCCYVYVYDGNSQLVGKLITKYVYHILFVP